MLPSWKWRRRRIPAAIGSSRATAASSHLGTPTYGSMGGKHLYAPVIDMVARPTGKGYWLAAEDGGVFGFGDVLFYGSLADKGLNGRITAMEATPNGAGYWLLGCDGGVFGFGNAAFFGSNPRYACRGTQPSSALGAAPEFRRLVRSTLTLMIKSLNRRLLLCDRAREQATRYRLVASAESPCLVPRRGGATCRRVVSARLIHGRIEEWVSGGSDGVSGADISGWRARGDRADTSARCEGGW